MNSKKIVFLDPDKEGEKKRKNALKQIYKSFSPDNQQAWNNLHKLATSKKSNDRYQAATILSSVFSQVPDKPQAWNDLHRLTNDKNESVRVEAACTLGSVFSQIIDKQQAWNDLHRLTYDIGFHFGREEAYVFCYVVLQLLCKTVFKNYLKAQIFINTKSFVRYKATIALGTAYNQLPNNKKAWKDVHRLTNDKSILVKHAAAQIICLRFSRIPDKQQAWNDLIRLIAESEDILVGFGISFYLGALYSSVPDKQQAWNDLHKLTTNNNPLVRFYALGAIEDAFPYVIDKQQAWEDLLRLSNDPKKDYDLTDGVIRTPEDFARNLIDIRYRANSILGKLSIYKASQAENEDAYKKELENAIEFFEESINELPKNYRDPADFCLSFYRSFYTIIFKGQEAKDEVDKYLKEAKSAVGNSKSKETLLEAVNNLANALKEVQSLEYIDLEEKKVKLDFYRQYCDRAAELMKDTEEKAPYATETIKKGLPIFDINLKELIEEIKKTAASTYRKSKGTYTTEVAHLVCMEVQKLEIGNQKEMKQKIEEIYHMLVTKIPPEFNYIHAKMKRMRNEKDLTKQYEYLLFLIQQLPNMDEKEVDYRNIGKKKDILEHLKQIVDILQRPVTISGYLGAFSIIICEILKTNYATYFILGVFVFSFLITISIDTYKK
jgi:HEAT repeat protein